MRIEPERLKDFLLDTGLITKEQFEEALKKAQEKNIYVGDVLVFEKLISEEELKKLEAYILGIPFINLEEETIEPEILKLIPEAIARAHNIVAFRKMGNNLEVAMLDPEDIKTIDFIKKTTGLKILPRLTTPQSIKNVLRQYRRSLELEFGEIIKKEAKEVKTVSEKEEVETKEDLRKIAQELPIVRIVDSLLRHAIFQRASDIHIEPTEKEVIVRYRIDGILRDAMVLPKVTAPAIVARVKVLSNLRLDEHRLPQDGRFKIEFEDLRYSIRVSVLPVMDGEKIVMRLLPETAKAFTLEQLGLRGESLERVQLALRKPTGMILVTGPTGCGKTTTLYSMIDILNTPEVNISTIEDPVEYKIPRVNQTQVNPKIGLTFGSGLRSLLRQDPDILMVGEIRDNETASLAVNAALTGHLVLSTLHTNSAAGALPRLIDMKVEPFLIASTLECVLAQRLVRRLCEDKEKYFLNPTQIKNLSQYVDLERLLKLLKEAKIAPQNSKIQDIPFFRPKKTETCPDGYSGRIGIFEVLVVTPTIKEMIQKKENADNIQAQAVKEGMILMVEDGLMKAAQGITSIEEVLRVIIE